MGKNTCTYIHDVVHVCSGPYGSNAVSAYFVKCRLHVHVHVHMCMQLHQLSNSTCTVFAMYTCTLHVQCTVYLVYNVYTFVRGCFLAKLV